MSARRRSCLTAAAISLTALLCAVPALAAADDVPPAPEPSPPAVSLPLPRALVRSVVSVSGRVDSRTVEVRITTPSQTVTVAVTPDSSGATFSVSVPLPYGKSTIGVAAGNSSGYSGTIHRVVYNLGAVPGGSHFVLVDKSDLYLYQVSGYRVAARYPVAIGMPGSPTPVGSWYMGRVQRMRRGGVWGVLRMPLMRKVRARVRITVHVHGRHVTKRVWRIVGRGNGYYIHGTNAPWSIGTAASHGCVRMYNSNVTALSKVVRGWPVTIRR